MRRYAPVHQPLRSARSKHAGCCALALLRLTLSLPAAMGAAALPPLCARSLPSYPPPPIPSPPPCLPLTPMFPPSLPALFTLLCYPQFVLSIEREFKHLPCLITFIMCSCLPLSLRACTHSESNTKVESTDLQLRGNSASVLF